MDISKEDNSVPPGVGFVEYDAGRRCRIRAMNLGHDLSSENYLLESIARRTK